MRKDERYTWSKDDDLQLVETILRHVRKGGSVIDGCREYAEATNNEHSVEANKFRFHTKLKHQYEKAYGMAKEEGKKVKQEKRKYTTQKERLNTVMLDIATGEVDEREVELEDVLVLLKRYMKQENNSSASTEVDKLRRDNEKLAKQVKELRESNIKLNKAFNEIEHDYKEIRNALQVLKGAGLALDIPSPTSTVKYKVGADGLIQTIE